MNSQQREAMQMALEAQEAWERDDVNAYYMLKALKPILREALAQPQDMKECRHCGWLCKPNDAPSKKGYVLAQPQENTARCGGCNKTAKEGWALYCVECWEKSNSQDDKNAQSLYHRFTANRNWNSMPTIISKQGEPVAWVVYDSEANDIVWTEEGKKLKAETPLYTTPPSVEAMRIETLEKAADLRKQIALQGVQSNDYEDGFWDGLAAYEKAIREMK